MLDSRLQAFRRVFPFVLVLFAQLGSSGGSGAVQAQCSPPFGGTIFIDPDIITPADPTTFIDAPYAGQGMRYVYDRRVGWIWMNAYLFNASFDDGLTAEVQVNPEFGSEAAASAVALEYGSAVGQLPTSLRTDVDALWIHQGVEPFGGGNNSILIHTGQAAIYVSSGILEETLVHEAAHTSLDATHGSAPGWLAAQSADNCFISTYAQDFPNGEDVAESFLPYLAAEFRADRISASLGQTITNSIPNRIAYFNAQPLDLYPITPALITFRRGDCNVDGATDIADAIFSLNTLFGSSIQVCPDACDANDSGTINIADPIYYLSILFQGFPSLPPGSCGPDPTADGLDCPGFTACP